MNTTALRHVRKLFCHEFSPLHVQRHNCRQWVKSIRFLGDRWLLATPVTRKAAQAQAAKQQEQLI